MEINKDIFTILKEHKIDKNKGTLALLAIYYKLDAEGVVPEDIIKGINLTKIVEKDYKVGIGTIKWNVPLFLGQQTEWEWVHKWNEAWRVKSDRKESNTIVIKRMQDFFKLYPKYRQDDVFKARDLYFKSLSSPQYLKNSAAFIFDGAGAMKKSALLTWCEKATENQTPVDDTAHQKGTILR